MDKPYQIERIGEQIVVFATSYLNPIDYLPAIETELPSTGKIIFDLLLCNGNNANRFVQATVERGKVDRASMSVVRAVEPGILALCQAFYRANLMLLENNEILDDLQKQDLLR